MTFGRLIMEARTGQKRTRRDVALAAGITENMVYLVETEKRVPSLTLALRLFRALGIDPEYLAEVES